MFVVVTLYREWTVGLQQVTYIFVKDILFASLKTLSHRLNMCSLWFPVSSTTSTPSSTQFSTPSCPRGSGGASMTWPAPAVRSGWGKYLIWGIWGNISHNGKSPEAHHLSKEFQSSQFISRHVSMWDEDWPLGNSWSFLDVAAVFWRGVQSEVCRVQPCGQHHQPEHRGTEIQKRLQKV